MLSYIEVRTNKPIIQEYDDYINGLFSRKSKPWKMSKDEGIVFINGNQKVYYKWSDVKDDVKRLSILKRTYLHTNLTLDEQIWQSFKSIGSDIWDDQDTYGIHTVDDYYLDWDSFKDMVENGQYEETPERINFMLQFDDIENMPKNEISISQSSEDNWYESIEIRNE